MKTPACLTAHRRTHRRSILATAVSLSLFSISQSALGQTTYNWNQAGGISTQLWSLNTNWTSNVVGGPDLAGDIAIINTNITGTQTIELFNTGNAGDNIKTVGRLDLGDLDGTNPFIIATGSGAGVLNFNNSGNGAQLNRLAVGGATAGDSITAAVTLSDNLTINNANSTDALSLFTGGITSATAGTKTITNAGTGTGQVGIGPGIGLGSGNIAIVQNSATSALVLSGTNTFTGGVTIKAGTLAGVRDTTVASGNTILLGDSDVNSNADSTLSFNGNLSRPITVVGGNTGTATIANAGSNDLTAPITLQTHDLKILTPGAFRFSGGITGTGNVTFNSGSSGNSQITNGSLNFTGAFTNISSGSSGLTLFASSTLGANLKGLIQNGSGPLTIQTSNTSAFIGDTTVTLGTANLRNSLGLQKSVINMNGGSLTFGGTTTNNGKTAVDITAVTIGGLGGSVGVNLLNSGAAGGAVALTIGNSNVSNGSGTNPNTLNPVYSGIISNSIGSASVTKVGSNTQTLSGSNTYTGATTVSAGTLLVNGSLGNTAVAVNAGTFGGTGTIAGSVTVGAATYAPGASPGSLEIAGNLTLGSTTTTAIDLGGTAFTLNGTEDYDRTKLTGGASTLTLAGALAVSLFGGFTLDDNQAFGIFQLASGANRSGTFTGLGEGAAVGTFGGKDLFITYEGDFGDSGIVNTFGGNDVGSSRVDLQACKLEYSIVSPK